MGFEQCALKCTIRGGVVTGWALAARIYWDVAETPLEAELEVLIKAVSLCLQRGFRRLILEGDCIILVDFLKCCGTLSLHFMAAWHQLLHL